MRLYIILFSGFLICAAAPAFACLGVSEENTLFFESIPTPELDADVIATVLLEDIKGGEAKARITKIFADITQNMHVGDVVTLQYTFTSCGPNHKRGDTGMILATFATDADGHATLYPYARRYSDSRVMPPLPSN